MKYVIMNKTFTNQNFHFFMFSVSLVFLIFVFLPTFNKATLLIFDIYTPQIIFNFITYSYSILT